jgi:hypothetical protein
MFVDSAGQHIADIMTMNRGLASIPSASAILDTSNYTFQAISYGKDAAGFQYHAHSVLSPSSDNIIKVISYSNSSFSGYHSSATTQALDYFYKLLPQSPTPLDTRLERSPTVPSYLVASGIPDIGQHINIALNQTLSSVYHLAGSFAPASGVNFKVYNQSNSLIFSGSLQSFYNTYRMMDSSGFLSFYQGSLADHNAGYTLVDSVPVLYQYGVIRNIGTNFPRDVDLKWLLPPGDAGTLNLFGGIYHIGLWCLDIKEMLKQGYTPPYNFNALNNIRKYRLFAKKTFNRDLITYSGNTAFKSLFINNGFANGAGIVLKWKIVFF